MNIKNKKARAAIERKLQQKALAHSAAAEPPSEEVEITVKTTKAAKKRRADPLRIAEKRISNLERENAELAKQVTKVRHVIEMFDLDDLD